MTPEEFYAAPTIKVDAWHESASVTREVLQIGGWDEYDNTIEETDPGLMTVHRKLEIDFDGRRGIAVSALYYDGQPFALMFTAGREHRDYRNAYVTDMPTWSKARNHVLELVNRNVTFSGGVTPSDVNLVSHYYGAAFSVVNGEARIVGPSDINPISGNPVIDRKKFEQSFNGFFLPYEDGVSPDLARADAGMMADAIDALQASIIGRKIHIDLDLGGNARLIGVNVVDDQTFLHILTLKDTPVPVIGQQFAWRGQITSHMAGPGSLAECYEDLLSGRPITIDCDYVKEASAAFDAHPTDVHRELMDFIKNGGVSLAQRIVAARGPDPRVDECIDDCYEDFVIAFMVHENPDVQRFCPDASPDHDDAVRRIRIAREAAAKRKGLSLTP